MIECKNCKKFKDDGDFCFKNKKLEIRHTVCKVCQRVYKTKYYLNNKETHYTRNKRQLDKIKKFIQEYKDSVACVLCGESENCCIDFHHIDENTKEYNIGNMAKYGSISKILGELEKCVPLCANCHRKVHAGIVKIEAG